jgi:NADH-quinone oxidoreductase subunit J
MLVFYSIFSLFSSLSLLSAIFVVISRSPIFSVLFLIFCFCNVSALLFLLNMEFFSITFIIVYVGAIAVLFLFVLMMLNIKISELKNNDLMLVPVALVLFAAFILEMSLLLHSSFAPIVFPFSQSLFLADFTTVNFALLDSSLFVLKEKNIALIGQVLFTNYAVYFIVVGFVLLLAMVAAITLTLHKTFVPKAQNPYYQVLRNFDTCLAFYS